MTKQADAQFVAAHSTHEAADLGPATLAALRAAAPHRDSVTLDDLAPIDQFHAGGIEATRALARRAAPHAGARVLDVGGGLGGPARTLDQEFGCTVTVLDLTEAFCRAGAFLTAEVGLSDQVTFQQGNALDLPFADGVFDLVWIQHASMNIADKERLYAELGRVLHPGGRLALYEVMAGAVTRPHFPVPWVQDAALSFLLPHAAVRALLADLGLSEGAWDDVTQPIGAGLRLPPSAHDRAASPPSSLSVVMGAAFPQMRANFARNIVEGRVVLIQAMFERIKPANDTHITSMRAEMVQNSDPTAAQEGRPTQAAPTAQQHEQDLHGDDKPGLVLNLYNVRYVTSALRDYPVWHCREVGAIAMALLDGNVQPHTSYEAGAPL